MLQSNDLGFDLARHAPSATVRRKLATPPSTPPESVMPNAMQLAMFRVIFASDEEFAAKWVAWRLELARTGEFDWVSLQHLPLLKSRISSQDNDPLCRLVCDQYRRTWATNQLLFRALKASINTLREAGIPTIVLKGAALITGYYKDLGVRSMGDFDILVPHADFPLAVRVLEARGWRSVLYGSKHFDLRFSHALPLKDGQGNVFDLHGHVLHLTHRDDTDKLFWEDSQPLDLDGVETRTLSPTDLLLHLAIHGLRWGPHPSLRWIPDIAEVLSRGETDWDRFVSMTRHLGASMAVTAVLGYMTEHGFATVPAQVMRSLYEIVPDRRERIFFRLNSHNTLGRATETIEFHWLIMCQQENLRTLSQKLRLFPSYLRFRAQAAGFHNIGDFLLRGSLLKHLRGKLGFYKTPAIDPRLR